jgi:hypothetical protein
MAKTEKAEGVLEMIVLAGDIGGTKTLLQLSRCTLAGGGSA